MPFPPLDIPSATRVPIQLVGRPVIAPVSGYRNWVGQIVAPQPAVALIMTVVGEEVRWTRTTNKGSMALGTSILFAPFDADGRDIEVCLTVLDATVTGRTQVKSQQEQPMPYVGQFQTGVICDIARVGNDPSCELKVLVLVRDDVHSVRNGVWHIRGAVASLIPEPWHTVLTYGRTGTFEIES